LDFGSFSYLVLCFLYFVFGDGDKVCALYNNIIARAHVRGGGGVVVGLGEGMREISFYIVGQLNDEPPSI
jgi:hypothetical protein